MKDVLTPKWVSIFMCILILIGLYLDRTQETTAMIAGLVIVFWLAITIHELGHVLFGKIRGFEFVFFTTGPIHFEKTEIGINITENKHWLLFGGVAMMTPPKVKKSKIINKMMMYVAGGPIFSLVAAIGSYFLYEQYSFEFLMFVTIMNGAILFATIIPLNQGMRTDGYILLALLKKNEESHNIVEDLLVSKELLGTKKPDKWDADYIQIAKQKEPSIDNLQYGMMIYYNEIERNGFLSAIEVMKGYHAIPVTNKNKFQVGFLIHMQQLAYFLTEEDVQIEEIVRLQELLSRVEPVSFYRGEAIIAFLQNDKHTALEYLKKVFKVIEQNENIYGFFTAEKTITQLVEDKILKANTLQDYQTTYR